MADNTAKITEEEEDEERREDDDPEQAISTNPEHRVVVVGASQEPPVEDSSSYSSFFAGFGASSCSAIDAETSKGSFDFYSNQHFNSSSYSRIRGGEFDDVRDAYFDDYYRDNKNPQEQEPVNNPNPNPNPEHHLAALVVPSSPRNAEISEIKNVDGDNENVPRDIDDDASSEEEEEEGYYEFSDKEKEAEYNRSGMRKMTSGEGTSSISRKKRKKKWCDRNRALRRSSNHSHSQNMAHYPPPPPPPPPPTQALYQNPMLGGQVSTLFPGHNYYGMQHQPLFIVPATMFPNQALMMHQQPPQYPPVALAPFGPFVLGQNFNPQMQPTQSQGFDLGRGGFGRDQHRGRGRGRRGQNYGRGRSRGRRGQNYGRGRGDGN